MNPCGSDVRQTNIEFARYCAKVLLETGWHHEAPPKSRTTTRG